MASLFGWSSDSVDRQDVVLVHLVLVAGLKEAVRRVVDVSISRRQANLRRGSIDEEASLEDASSSSSIFGDEDDGTVELTERLPEVRHLIQILEVILWHGLVPSHGSESSDSPKRNEKRATNPLLNVQGSGSRATETSPWTLIQSLEHVNAAAFGATLMLVRLNARASTDRGLTRAWLRQLLNQNALEFTLRALCKLVVSPSAGSSRQRRSCYEEWAFLRWTNEANRSMLFNLLGALNGIGFALQVASPTLDGPPSKSPGYVITTQSLACAMAVEFALAAAQSLEPGAEETLLVVSAKDPQVSGRYVFLERGLFANKISGFVMRRCDDSDGTAGWGIFAPHLGPAPLYFCPCDATQGKDLASPPLSGWRVSSRPGVFEIPALLRLRFPGGLATRALDRNCIGAVKEVLVRDEIQALRVEIKQVAAERARLDVLRKTRASEFQILQGTAEQNNTSRPESANHGTTQVMALPATAFVRAPGGADSSSSSGHSSHDMDESHALREDNEKPGHGNESPVGADDRLKPDKIEKGDGIALQAESEHEVALEEEASAKDGQSVHAKENDIEPSEMKEADNALSLDDTAQDPHHISVMPDLCSSSKAFEFPGTSFGESSADSHETDVQSESSASIEKRSSPPIVHDTSATTGSTFITTTSSSGECPDQEPGNEQTPATAARFIAVKDAMSECNSDGNQEAGDHEDSRKIESENGSATLVGETPAIGAAFSGSSKSSSPKKKKKKAKLVKVASFEDGSDLSDALTSASRHSSRRGNKTSIIAATVYDSPKPTQVITPKGGDEETDEERMQRFAREEEESLAQFIAAQEQQACQKNSSEQDASRSLEPPAISQPSLKTSPHNDTKAAERAEETLNDLVRAYSRLEDPYSAEALDLALCIFQEANYVVGPMPKKDSPARSWRGRASTSCSGGGEDALSTDSPPLVSSSSSKVNATRNRIFDLAFAVPKIVSAEVAGQHINRGSDTHVRFVIRVKLERQKPGQNTDRVSGDASILSGEEHVVSAGDNDSDGRDEQALSVAITVQRRFREFRELCADLQRSLNHDVKLPALPKTAWVRSFAEDYIYKKRRALNAFLQDLLTCDWPGQQDRVLAEHVLVIEFLTRDSNIHLFDLKNGCLGSKESGASVVPSPTPGGIRVSLITEPRPDTYKLEQNDSVGLAEQDFKCTSCARDLSIALGNKVKGAGLLSGFTRPLRKTNRSARFCHYLERWFCPGCFHTGNSSETARKPRHTTDSRRVSTGSSASADSSGGNLGSNSSTNPFATNSANPFNASNDVERSSSLDQQRLKREEGESGSDADELDEVDYASMKDHLHILPTRVLHRWDFDLFPVSHAAAIFLESTWDHPVLCVSASNPALFGTVSQLQHARLLRVQLTLARELVHECPMWKGKHMQLESPLVTGAHSCAHLARDTELYSLSDLFEMYLGNLITQLSAGVDHLANHITSSCETCKARGEKCEMCGDQAPIYPFQIMTVVQCRKCKSHFHRGCFKGEDKCVRCLKFKSKC